MKKALLLLPAASLCCGLAALLAARTGEAGAAPLLFTIGMHIEPFGAAVSPLAGGGSAPSTGLTYRTGPLFDRHVADIRLLAEIVERHGGRMTVQAQTPFTTVVAGRQHPVLSELEARGHEIALHFHEDAHLGRNPERLPASTWCAVMKEEIEALHAAGARGRIRYWSGGNLFSGLLDAAACAGLDVNSDWKNPRTQTTDPLLIGVNPWRPAGGPSAASVDEFSRHHPNGRIVFLPEGDYSRGDFASMRRAEMTGREYFEYLKRELDRSLAACRPDRVNVFHFTVHPGEFRGAGGRPFAVIGEFLAEAVEPLVREGSVRWATLPEMADAFIEWERRNPGAAPRG